MPSSQYTGRSSVVDFLQGSMKEIDENRNGLLTLINEYYNKVDREKTEVLLVSSIHHIARQNSISSGVFMLLDKVSGKNILMEAIEKECSQQIIHALIKNSPTDIKSTKNRTSLMFSAVMNRTDILQNILSKEQSWDETDLDGKTAFILAAEHKNKEFLEKFVELDVNNNIHDKEKQKALINVIEKKINGMDGYDDTIIFLLNCTKFNEMLIDKKEFYTFIYNIIKCDLVNKIDFEKLVKILRITIQKGYVELLNNLIEKVYKLDTESKKELIEFSCDNKKTKEIIYLLEKISVNVLCNDYIIKVYELVKNYIYDESNNIDKKESKAIMDIVDEYISRNNSCEIDCNFLTIIKKIIAEEEAEAKAAAKEVFKRVLNNIKTEEKNINKIFNDFSDNEELLKICVDNIDIGLMNIDVFNKVFEKIIIQGNLDSAEIEKTRVKSIIALIKNHKDINSSKLLDTNTANKLCNFLIKHNKKELDLSVFDYIKSYSDLNLINEENLNMIKETKSEELISHIMNTTLPNNLSDSCLEEINKIVKNCIKKIDIKNLDMINTSAIVNFLKKYEGDEFKKFGEGIADKIFYLSMANGDKELLDNTCKHWSINDEVKSKGLLFSKNNNKGILGYFIDNYCKLSLKLFSSKDRFKIFSPSGPLNNLNNDGQNPLMEAAQYGFKKVVFKLLPLTNNILLKDQAGNNLLKLAIIHGHYSLVKELIYHDEIKKYIFFPEDSGFFYGLKKLQLGIKQEVLINSSEIQVLMDELNKRDDVAIENKTLILQLLNEKLGLNVSINFSTGSRSSSLLTSTTSSTLVESMGSTVDYQYPLSTGLTPHSLQDFVEILEGDVPVVSRQTER